jgi:hypothetical protein
MNAQYYFEYKALTNLRGAPLLKMYFQGKTVCKQIRFTLRKIYYSFRERHLFFEENDVFEVFEE